VLRLTVQALQYVVRDGHFVNSSIFVIRDAWKHNLAALQPNRHELYSLFTVIHVRGFHPTSVSPRLSFVTISMDKCERFVEAYTLEHARLFVRAHSHALSCLSAAFICLCAHLFVNSPNLCYPASVLSYPAQNIFRIERHNLALLFHIQQVPGSHLWLLELPLNKEQMK
jgi:hypothetical protein